MYHRRDSDATYSIICKVLWSSTYVVSISLIGLTKQTILFYALDNLPLCSWIVFFHTHSIVKNISNFGNNIDTLITLNQMI